MPFAFQQFVSIPTAVQEQILRGTECEGKTELELDTFYRLVNEHFYGRSRRTEEEDTENTQSSNASPSAPAAARPAEAAAATANGEAESTQQGSQTTPERQDAEETMSMQAVMATCQVWRIYYIFASRRIVIELNIVYGYMVYILFFE
jgi:hypothetical protein